MTIPMSNIKYDIIKEISLIKIKKNIIWKSMTYNEYKKKLSKKSDYIMEQQMISNC